MIGGRLNDKDDRPEAAATADVRADLRAAYERGRQDERAARKRHPLMMTLTIAAALVGAVLLALAAVNGSFQGAGGAVDQGLTAAAEKAGPAAREAADSAGRNLHDATRSPRSDSAG